VRSLGSNTDDVNDLPPGRKDSIGWCQQTRGGRRRASAARTYLGSALKRPNLELVINALVHRMLFDGKRATDLEFSRGGPASNNIERADAAREVILSAGAAASAKVLTEPVPSFRRAKRRSGLVAATVGSAAPRLRRCAPKGYDTIQRNSLENP
jgi:hypothetical protein